MTDKAYPPAIRLGVHMTENRVNPRSLCADLVELEWRDDAGALRIVPAILEDISPRGACLQVEYPVPISIEVTIRHEEPWSIECRTTYCNYREIGYFLGLEFKPGERWSKRAFRPQHLLDLTQLMPHGEGWRNRAE
jgi:hypothetical protein